MAQIDYPMVIVPLDRENGGGYAAYAIDLPGCMADGETSAEALEELRQAVGEWIAEAVRLGREVPTPGAVIERAKREKVALKTLIAELVGEADSSLKTIIEAQIQKLASHPHDGQRGRHSAIAITSGQTGSMLTL